MLIYSEQIIRFVHEIKQTIRWVLSQEVRVEVKRERFYIQATSYPVNVVIYNNKAMLGYFDPHFYELGFHECLMHVDKEQLHDVIRHELAHYMTFIHHGEYVQPHGPEFKTFCTKMGWKSEVAKATTVLHEEKSAILRKVQKLLSLATSSNQHEAEQALLKSRELLLKHNMEMHVPADEEKIFLKRILKQKKETAKMRAIAKILETFFVSTVYHKGHGFIYLEILGTAVNIEIAEYVADVLESELEHLWNKTFLSGTREKNSFFLGLAKGYCDKVHALQNSHTHALILLEKQLTRAKQMVYPSLSSSRSAAQVCLSSYNLGTQMGHALNIHKGVTTTSEEKRLLP